MCKLKAADGKRHKVIFELLLPTARLRLCLLSVVGHQLTCASTTMLRFLIISLVCLLGVASAARGRVGANGRGGWARKPLAVGALGGTEPGLEPYLLEFHGANCDHCEVSDRNIFGQLVFAACRYMKRAFHSGSAGMASGPYHVSLAEYCCATRTLLFVVLYL